MEDTHPDLLVQEYEDTLTRYRAARRQKRRSMRVYEWCPETKRGQWFDPED